MLAHYPLVVVEVFEAFTYFVRLQDNRAGKFIYGSTAGSNLLDNHRGSWYFLFVDCNSQIIDNHSGVVAMHVTLTSPIYIIVKRIAPKEKFTYITPNVPANRKLATWMKVNKLANIENEII